MLIPLSSLPPLLSPLSSLHLIWVNNPDLVMFVRSGGQWGGGPARQVQPGTGWPLRYQRTSPHVTFYYFWVCSVSVCMHTPAKVIAWEFHRKKHNYCFSLCPVCADMCVCMCFHAKVCLCVYRCLWCACIIICVHTYVACLCVRSSHPHYSCRSELPYQ